MTLSSTSETLEIGQSVTLVATPRDATGTALTGRTITWSTSAPAVATVTGGVVTAVSAGPATITASSEGKTATAQITVNAPPPLTCNATTPTGRLDTTGPSKFIYVTNGNWRIEIVGWTITIIQPNAQVKIENWGSTPPTNLGPGAAMGHENLNGKHIKDWMTQRRTNILPDGTVITLDGVGPTTGRVSIYDVDQTHRLANTLGEATVVWSCLHGMFGEAEEADGETSRLRTDGEGWIWELIHDQAGPDGNPGEKVPNIQLLARTFFNNPNQVNDFFDDPRLGHTE